MRLSVAEEKILCSLDVDENIYAREEKIQATLHLIQIYDHGTETIPQDQWSAIKYKKKLGLAYQKPIPEFVSTHRIYNYFSLFNAIRLSLVRANRIGEILKNPLIGGFLKFFGLSYGVELLYDLGVIFYSTFFKRVTEFEQGIPYFTRIRMRFQQVIHKDGRPSRMANAAVWFSINLVSLFVTSGLSGILNGIGFTFDVVQVAKKVMQKYKSHGHYLEKITSEIGEQNHLLLFLKQENKNVIHIKNCEAEIEKLNLIQSKLQNKMKAIRHKAAYKVTVATLILAGMILFFIPPTSMIGLTLTGAGLALVCGSVLSGLGPRIWKKIKSHYKNKNPVPIAYVPLFKQTSQPSTQNSYAKHCRILLNNDADIIATLTRKQMQDAKSPEIKQQDLIYARRLSQPLNIPRKPLPDRILPANPSSEDSFVKTFPDFLWMHRKELVTNATPVIQDQRMSITVK